MSAELERVDGRRRLPATIDHPADAELELRRHQALLDVMRRGRADQREQVVVLRRCVEYAIRGVDLVDEMRAGGELRAGPGQSPEARGIPTLADVGLNDRRVAEWRSLRDNDALGFLDQALADDRWATFERVGIQWVRERVERLEREQSTAAAAAEHFTAGPDNDVEIRHGDFRDTLADLDGQVDAIICDPPYAAAWVRRDGAALADLAARLLKPTGTLAVLFGQTAMFELQPLLAERLVYRWCGCLLTSGPRPRVFWQRVAPGWKPVLIFTQPDAPQAPFLLDDVFASGGADKEHHVWGQSETGIARIAQSFTRPGELVVDPFLGGGTTAVVCRELGRRFVGCDIDAAAVSTARARLA